MARSAAPVTDPAFANSEPSYVAPDLVRVDGDGHPHLIGGRCRACGANSFPKAAVCTACLSEEIDAVALAREGRLYSYSVVHQAPRGWRVPYALGYVDLPGDIRVLAHLAADPAQLRIDMPVRLGVGEVGTDPSGQTLVTYTFSPIE